MQVRCGTGSFRPSAAAERRTVSARCSAVTVYEYLVFSRKPPRSASPNGELTSRACKPVASPKRPMSNGAGPAALCQARPLPNPSRPLLRQRRVGPHQPRRKLRQPQRRKKRLLRPPRHLRRLRYRKPLRRKTRQPWRPGILQMKLPRRPAARPTPSFGSACRLRSITSWERRAMGPQSAAPSCARRKLSPARTGRQRLKSIRDLGRVLKPCLVNPIWTRLLWNPSP
ncbi:hypothetical protein ACVWWK_001250 [Bradyrhizobium sp. LB9.1b]